MQPDTPATLNGQPIRAALAVRYAWGTPAPVRGSGEGLRRWGGTVRMRVKDASALLASQAPATYVGPLACAEGVLEVRGPVYVRSVHRVSRLRADATLEGHGPPTELPAHAL